MPEQDTNWNKVRNEMPAIVAKAREFGGNIELFSQSLLIETRMPSSMGLCFGLSMRYLISCKFKLRGKIDQPLIPQLHLATADASIAKHSNLTTDPNKKHNTLSDLVRERDRLERQGGLRAEKRVQIIGNIISEEEALFPIVKQVQLAQSHNKDLKSADKLAAEERIIFRDEGEFSSRFGTFSKASKRITSAEAVSYFLVLTQNHAMAAVRNRSEYTFFDPNFGSFSFSSSTQYCDFFGAFFRRTTIQKSYSDGDKKGIVLKLRRYTL